MLAPLYVTHSWEDHNAIATAMYDIGMPYQGHMDRRIGLDIHLGRSFPGNGPCHAHVIGINRDEKRFFVTDETDMTWRRMLVGENHTLTNSRAHFLSYAKRFLAQHYYAPF